MALAAALPRTADPADMRYQWISRFIDNEHVVSDDVTAPFAIEVLERAAGQGAVVLIVDQSKASDRHQILMLSLRWGERALPLAWRVEATEGAIGFARQKDLLDAVTAWLPQQADICLMADRFYGTPDLIALAQAKGWRYRLRLKGNQTTFINGQKSRLDSHALGRMPYLRGAELTHKRVVTNIGIIHDRGHDEPWFVAMSDVPGYLTTLDYTARWGIEPMFSDFKSRGFGLEQSQLRTPDRLGRLLLVMSLALYFAVSTGIRDATVNPSVDKKSHRRQPTNLSRSRLSWFTRGLRYIDRLVQFCLPMPALCEPDETDGCSGQCSTSRSASSPPSDDMQAPSKHASIALPPTGDKPDNIRVDSTLTGMLSGIRWEWLQHPNPTLYQRLVPCPSPLLNFPG